LVSMGIISDIPKDRNLDNVVSGLGTNSIEWNWDFAYMVSTKNSVLQGGFILMAKTETPGGSNWVVTITWGAQNTNYTGGRLTPWTWTSNTDLKYVKPCQKIVQIGDTDCPNNKPGLLGTAPLLGGVFNDVCCYSDASQLRYIYIY
jgi:hypothetical protein